MTETDTQNSTRRRATKRRADSPLTGRSSTAHAAGLRRAERNVAQTAMRCDATLRLGHANDKYR